TITTSPTSVQQVSGVTDPFNVTVTARDADGNVITNYNSTSVTVTPNSGTLSTATCGTFSNGVCTLANVTLNSVTIPNTQNAVGVQLTASDNGSPAHTGTGSITVYRPVDHLVIKPPLAGFTQKRNAAFATLTVTAVDVFGNTVTADTGTYTLSI